MPSLSPPPPGFPAGPCVMTLPGAGGAAEQKGPGPPVSTPVEASERNNKPQSEREGGTCQIAESITEQAASRISGRKVTQGSGSPP